MMILERERPADPLLRGTMFQEGGARYRTCPGCGQVYDIQHMGQVYRHDDQPHEPMSPFY